MNQLSEYNNSLKEGEKRLENNEFFQDLCGLMENEQFKRFFDKHMGNCCLLYTSPSPRDRTRSRMPSSA